VMKEFEGFKEIPVETMRARFNLICKQIAIHEFAHVAEDGFDRKDVQGPDQWICEPLIAFKAHLMTTEVQAYGMRDLHHGAAWIRCTIHANHRAVSLDQFTGLFLVMGLHFMTLVTEDYDLSPAYKYVNALGDEPERLEGASFPEILATEPPAEFTDLFNADDQARRQGKTP